MDKNSELPQSHDLGLQLESSQAELISHPGSIL